MTPLSLLSGSFDRNDRISLNLVSTLNGDDILPSKYPLEITGHLPSLPLPFFSHKHAFWLLSIDIF